MFVSSYLAGNWRKIAAPFYFLFLNFCLATTSLAQTTSNGDLVVISAKPPSTEGRPKVALVLSGGGARGFAHIGVLRALRKLRIPVDMVVGTSIGAVVGGAYAAGRTPDELEQIVSDTKWDAVLSDRPARYDLDMTRKEEDVLLPTRIEFAVTKAGVSLPKAAAANVALEDALNRLLPEGLRDQPVDQLALPFRSVASDLLTGEKVELNNTPLLPSMRASLALPGVFAPARIDKKLVVDGGLVNNLPIEIAIAMGAERIIAVNVGTPLAKEQEITSAVDVAKQMLNILTEQNVQRSIQNLNKRDILISPELSGISFLDFNQFNNSILAGEKATYKLQERLAELSVSDADYQRYEQYLAFGKWANATPQVALPIANIEVKGVKHINPAALIGQTGLQIGESKSQQEIRQASNQLYGRGDLDQIETQIRDEDGKRYITITPTESNASRNRLRLGLELNSDFADENGFSLSAMHIASSLNSYGAELRTLIRVGHQKQFGMRLIQPLAPASPWYVAPAVEYNANVVNVFEDGFLAARVGNRTTLGTLALGRHFGNWGTLEFGLAHGFAKNELLMPISKDSQFQEKVFGSLAYVKFRLDTLDSLAYPTRGSMIDIRLDKSQSREISTSVSSNAFAQGLRAFKYGDWSGHILGEWQRTDNGGQNALGGFLRLSGTAKNSIAGEKTVFGRVVVNRKLGSLPSAIGGSIGLGFSAELGIAYDNKRELSFHNVKQAGSAHFSIDTRFGPLYLGAGATRGQGSSYYLFLGPIW